MARKGREVRVMSRKEVEMADEDSYDQKISEQVSWVLEFGYSEKLGRIEALRQLCRKPTWDGDLTSKTLRSELVQRGLAAQVACWFSYGYQTATPFGLSVFKEVVRICAEHGEIVDMTVPKVRYE